MEDMILTNVLCLFPTTQPTITVFIKRTKNGEEMNLLETLAFETLNVKANSALMKFVLGLKSQLLATTLENAMSGFTVKTKDAFKLKVLVKHVFLLKSAYLVLHVIVKYALFMDHQKLEPSLTKKLTVLDPTTQRSFYAEAITLGS